MSRLLNRMVTVGILAVVATAVLGPLAAGATSAEVVLNLEAGSVNRTAKACSLVHHYTFYKRAVGIRMNGVVSPPPAAASWSVKVKVKRCVAGRFRTIWVGHVTGRKAGRFDLVFRTRRPGYYFARAYYYGATPPAESDKEYFRVT